MPACELLTGLGDAEWKAAGLGDPGLQLGPKPPRAQPRC